MKGTREKIVAKALELFNENGIEYVGMRELAAVLGMRIGNITYYFPTKDDLVFEIASVYSISNSELHTTNVESLYDFLHKMHKTFVNGVNYRCLMLSMVHIMDQNQLVAENYKKVTQMRSTGLNDAVALLNENGYLTVNEKDAAFLVAINTLIGRFWYSDAALNTKRSQIADYTGYYMQLFALLFKPYATQKGVKDIERFLEDNQLTDLL